MFLYALFEITVSDCVFVTGRERKQENQREERKKAGDYTKCRM